MGLFSFLKGKTPEEIESDGDNYMKANEFGAAKVEFEKALHKAESKCPDNQNLILRLHSKIRDSKESLAAFHKQTAEYLAESGNNKEADDLLLLAFELTEDENLKADIKNTRKQMKNEHQIVNTEITDMKDSEPDYDVTEEADMAEDEYFSVLCSALPDDVTDAYNGYGQTFKQGFIALNRGEFETAVAKLSDAMKEFPGPDSLIPIELATALINQEHYDQARDLLERFVENNPEEERGYQMLCDIFWITGNYDNAVRLIGRCPEKIKDTFPIQFLLGETYYQMGKYSDAEKTFQRWADSQGQNEIATRSLAKTYEAMGEIKKARDIYGGILKGCARCGARTDPYVKRRYAELCYTSEDRSQRLLEIYFSLVQEDPDNKNDYFKRIHGIYADMGNEKEARRYLSFIV